jgi:5-methylcytosine-specific restriction endonuclease McrA
MTVIAAPRDRRYGLQRWARLARRILRRDNYVCRIVPGCPTRATIADHIIPDYPGMPDALFFSEDNLRAGCKRHNYARGVAERLQRETRGAPPASSSIVTRDYSRGA